MLEETKEGKQRAKRPEIKIAVKDFQDLEAYGKVTNKSPTRIVNELVKDFLAREDVKKIVEENGESAKAKKDIEKMEAKIEQLQIAVAEKKKKHGLGWE